MDQPTTTQTNTQNTDLLIGIIGVLSCCAFGIPGFLVFLVWISKLDRAVKIILTILIIACTCALGIAYVGIAEDNRTNNRADFQFVMPDRSLHTSVE